MAKSTRPIIRIHDLENNKIIDRQMTDEEFEAHQIAQELQTAAVAAAKAEAEAKEAARQAILDRLGITEEEAQLLLGGN